MALKPAGFGLMQGLLVVLKSMTRKRITEQYPEERLNVSRRTRAPLHWLCYLRESMSSGQHQDCDFNWDEQ